VFDFIVDNEGNSALHLAYLKRQSALALWLIQYGMDSNLKNKHGLKPHEVLGDDNISLLASAAISSASRSVIDPDENIGTSEVNDDSDFDMESTQHSALQRNLSEEKQSSKGLLESYSSSGCHGSRSLDKHLISLRFRSSVPQQRQPSIQCTVGNVDM